MNKYSMSEKEFENFVNILGVKNDTNIMNYQNCLWHNNCEMCSGKCLGAKCDFIKQFSSYVSLSEIDSMYYLCLENLKFDDDLIVRDKEVIKEIEQLKRTIYDRVEEGGFNLLLASNNSGNGKTTSAIKLALSYMAKRAELAIKCQKGKDGMKTLKLGFPVFFVNWPDLVFTKNNSFIYGKNTGYKEYSWSDYYKLMLNAELLILDDIGGASGKNHELDILYHITEHRRKYNMSTIYTSNLAPAELKEYLGQRTYDRAFAGAEYKVFKDGSHRGDVKNIQPRHMNKLKEGIDVF